MINLDQAALAMYPAYGYATMLDEGRLYFPWFDFIPGPLDIPVSISFGGPTGKLAAVGGALALSIALGLALHFLVFGPLRHSPAISKIIASLGVLSYLQALAVHHFGASARQVDGIIPDGRIENVLGLGGNLAYDRIVLAGCALIVALALTVYYRRTNAGLATLAAHESEHGIALLGWSPQGLAVLNWLISAVVTGMAGVLFLDVTSLSPSRYTLLIVPALGAALFGNLTSVWMAAVGGIAIGVIQSSAVGLAAYDWWPEAIPAEGLRDVIPLLVIVGFQFFRGQMLPSRAVLLEHAQPRAPLARSPLAVAVFVVVAVAVLSSSATGASEARLVTTLIAAILMLSSMVLVGYLGQVSLANLAFAGVAAYVAAKLASDGSPVPFSPFAIEGPGLPQPLAALIGVSAAVALGCLVAVSALRIRGIHLAVVTLAAAAAATELIFANPAIVGRTAGANTPIPRPEWFGIDVASRDPVTALNDHTPFTVLVTILLVLAILMVLNLRRGMTGRRMLAVRSNERAARSLGVDATAVKLLGFAISAGLAGVAGVLMSYQISVLQIQSWSAFDGITNLTLLFVGGIGSIFGVLIGAALIPAGVLSSSSSSGEILRAAVAGIAMIAMAVKRPDGLSSFGASLVQRLRSLRSAVAEEWKSDSESDGPAVVILEPVAPTRDEPRRS